MNSARALHELQATDQQLASRRSEYRRVTRDLETQGGLPSLRERAERARKGELEARLESARLESESAALSERLARLEERLYGGAITNVRELTAIETEHAGAKRELAQVDESSEPAQIAAAEAMKLNEQRQAELEEAERNMGRKREPTQVHEKASGPPSASRCTKSARFPRPASRQTPFPFITLS